MLDVLCPLITEADFISNELLDIILIHIVEPNKTQKKNASNLARDLVSKTSDTLEPYIQQVRPQLGFLNKIKPVTDTDSSVFLILICVNTSFLLNGVLVYPLRTMTIKGGLSDSCSVIGQV